MGKRENPPEVRESTAPRPAATRVRMAVPNSVIERIEAVQALRFPDGERKIGVLYAEALLRGLRALEIEAAPLSRQRYIEQAERAGTPLRTDETRRVVAREDGPAFGERCVREERRNDDRGATTGRRVSDHEEKRRPFLRRVRTLLKVGHSPEDIAALLGAEGTRTSAGGPWTPEAIEQIGQFELEKVQRQSWRPESL